MSGALTHIMIVDPNDKVRYEVRDLLAKAKVGPDRKSVV